MCTTYVYVYINYTVHIAYLTGMCIQQITVSSIQGDIIGFIAWQKKTPYIRGKEELLFSRRSSLQPQLPLKQT